MYKNIIILMLGAIILCFAAFNNKFPLLTADTGFFINSGFNQGGAFHHTTLYGLFIAHSSWGRLIWLIIFSQCLILSATLLYAFRYFINGRNYAVPYLAFVFFTTFCMSASVTSSTIHPGVFASVTIVSTGLLLFAKNLSHRDFIIIATITVFSSGMAMANLFTVLIVTVIYAISVIFENRNSTSAGIQSNIKRIITVLSLAGTTFLLASAFHLFSGGNFNINDLAKSQNAIKGKVADIRANKGIAVKMASTPGFNPEVKTSKKTLSNSINIEITGYNSTVQQSETFQAIYKWYNSDVRECLIARQFQGWLTFTYLNYAQIISVFVCIFLTIISIIKRPKSNYRFWLVFICLAVLIQMLINTLLLSGTNYSLAHIVWLLPMPVFLYLSETEMVKKADLN